ncbi:MAG: hypothetical protein WC626_06770 [Methanoregula sp.]
MTAARRMTILCRNAKVLLKVAGYNVIIVPERSLQQRFLAHLIASKGNADVRYIRIKISIKMVVSFAEVEKHCVREICEIRKQIARNPKTPRFHGEIWVATADGRFQCYEISLDALRETSPGTRALVTLMEGAVV